MTDLAYVCFRWKTLYKRAKLKDKCPCLLCANISLIREVFIEVFIIQYDWLIKQHLHWRECGVCFFPLCSIHYSSKMNESHKLYKNAHTVATQSSLTSTLFNHLFSLFIHCSSHSLLSPPPYHLRRPIVWPGEGVSCHGGRYNGVIDTGDPMHWARGLCLPFSFHDWVKHL